MENVTIADYIKAAENKGWKDKWLAGNLKIEGIQYTPNGYSKPCTINKKEKVYIYCDNNVKTTICTCSARKIKKEPWFVLDCSDAYSKKCGLKDWKKRAAQGYDDAYLMNGGAKEGAKAPLEEFGKFAEAQAKAQKQIKNRIFYGSPGTGKTYKAQKEAEVLINNNENVNKDLKKPEKQYIRFCTFHQSYSYEEFIEGFRLTDKGGCKLQDGIFKSICEIAKNDSDNNYVLIIDEINRGNISKIFGEVVTLIEEDKRIGEENAIETTLPYSQKEFGVPSNLYIIGTMNTTDRSIALLDMALRRRFHFEEVMPYYEYFSNEKFNDIKFNNDEKVDIGEILKTINNRIEYLIDRDHVIGHAYFNGVSDVESVIKVIKEKIIPILQEYFHDEWEKIAMVLGGAGKSDSTDYFLSRVNKNKKHVFNSVNDDNKGIEDNKDFYKIANTPSEEALKNITQSQGR